MNDIAFETALRNALIRDLENEYSIYLNADFVPVHTAKYLRFEKRILKNPIGYVNQANRSVWVNILQRAAIVIIAIMTIAGLMMTIPPVRAFVFSIIEEFVDHNEHTTDVGDINRVIGDCELLYLPEGYSPNKDNGNGFYEWSNGKSRIAIQYDYVGDGLGVSLNADGVKTDDIYIGEFNAVLYRDMTGREINAILWYDETEKLYFLIMSDIEVDEMIKIAEGIQLK